MDNLDFKSFLSERMRAKGYTLKKLADASGIPIEQLDNFARGFNDELPAAPYLKGYLRTLGKLLGFDPAVWVDYFAQIRAMRSSGTEDTLPGNRFALRSVSRYIWVGALVLLVAIYGIFRFGKITGRPSLTITSPAEDTVRVSQNTFSVSGHTDDTDEILVNSEPVVVNRDGTFEKEIGLEPGVNVIEVEAKKTLGGEVKYSRQVVYEPPVEAASSSAPASAGSSASSTTATSSGQGG